MQTEAEQMQFKRCFNGWLTGRQAGTGSRLRNTGMKAKGTKNIAGKSKETKRVQSNIDDLAEDKGAGSVYMYDWLIVESGNR